MVDTVELTFPGEGATDVSHLVRYKSKDLNKRLMTDDRKSVIDTFSFALKHDATISDKLKAANDKILISVSRDATDRFTGYIAPTFGQRIHQVADSIQLEAFDNSWLLDEPLQTSFAYPSVVGDPPYKIFDPADTGNSIVHQLLDDAGYTIATDISGSCPTISDTVEHIAGTAGDRTYREIIDTLLFEYGYVFTFDASGKFLIYQWDKSSVVASQTISYVGTNAGCTYNKRDNPHDGYKVEWSETDVFSDALLYRENLPIQSPDAGPVFPGKDIAAGDYFPTDGDIMDIYQQFRTTWLDTPYLTRQTRLQNDDLSLIATSDHTIEFSADANVGIDTQGFEAKRSQVLFQNAGGSTEKIYTFEIRGTALFRASRRWEKAPSAATNPEVYTTEHLYDQADAQRLASAMHLARKYGDFEYTFEHRDELEIGDVIQLQQTKGGIDTTVIVVDVRKNLDLPMWSYRALGITEYSDQSPGSGSDFVEVQNPISEADTQTNSGTETVPPENGAITDLTGDTYARVQITFTVGDDSHGGLYQVGQYSGLAGHRIWRRLHVDGSEIQLVGNVKDPSQTTHVDASSEDGVEYDYGISAYDNNGNESQIAWYGTPVTPQLTDLPDDVGSIAATAYPRQIVVEWDQVGGPNGPYTYDLERDTGSGYAALASDLAVNTYVDIIGEVEYSTLSNHRYRVRAKDAYGNYSASYTATVAAPDRDRTYGTWTPATVAAGAIKATAGNRTIALAVQTQGYATADDTTDDLIEGVGLRVQITNAYTGNPATTDWYAPNFDTGTQKGTAPDRWKTGALGGYADVRSFIIALYNLPLTNEENPPTEDEVYHLRVKYIREDGTASGAWSDPVECTCTATTAYDYVRNAFKAYGVGADFVHFPSDAYLIGHWELDEFYPDGSDYKSKDASAQENAAVLDSSGSLPSFTDAIVGQAPDFDGSSWQHVEILDAATAASLLTGQFAISLWFQSGIETTGDGAARIVTRDHTEYFLVAIDQTDAYSAQTLIVGKSGNDDSVDIDGSLPHHICANFDTTAGTIDWYVDGELIAQQTGWTPTGTSRPLVIAGNTEETHSNSNYFVGWISSIRLYNKNLDEAEIKSLLLNPGGPRGIVVARQIFTEELSTITANIGIITNGALNSDATYNFRNLETGENRFGDADSYVWYDPDGGPGGTALLTLKMDSIYVSSLTTRVLGASGNALEISDAGDLETGLTNPIEIYTESSGSNGVIEHPTEIDLRINAIDILTVDSTGIGVRNGSPSALLEVGGDADGEILVTSTEGRKAVLEADDSDNYVHVGSVSSHDFIIVAADLKRIHIDQTGDITFYDSDGTTSRATVEDAGNLSLAGNVVIPNAGHLDTGTASGYAIYIGDTVTTNQYGNLWIKGAENGTTGLRVYPRAEAGSITHYAHVGYNGSGYLAYFGNNDDHDAIIIDGSGYISFGGDRLRLNHDGSSFTDDDGYLYFASDAYFRWDESLDNMYLNKDFVLLSSKLSANTSAGGYYTTSTRTSCAYNTWVDVGISPPSSSVIFVMIKLGVEASEIGMLRNDTGTWAYSKISDDSRIIDVRMNLGNLEIKQQSATGDPQNVGVAVWGTRT